MSKFACLRIDDDSDKEDFCTNVDQQTQPTNKGNKPINSNKANGGRLLVHEVPKRQKQKKQVKAKVIDPLTGIAIQDEGELRAPPKTVQKDAPKGSSHTLMDRSNTAMELNAAIKSSFSSIDEELLREVLTFCQQIREFVMLENGENSSSLSDIIIRGDRFKNSIKGSPNSLLLNLLLDNSVDLAKEHQEKQAAKQQAHQIKTKYIKLVDLFKDCELREKSQIVIDLDKTRCSEKELGEQLQLAQQEMERMRSKLRLYEGKK